MSYSIKPSSVSRFLASDKRFRRAVDTPTRVKGMMLTSSGFKVYGYDDRTFVQHFVSDGWRMREERHEVLLREALRKMADFLEVRYDVTIHMPPKARGLWKLEVRQKRAQSLDD